VGEAGGDGEVLLDAQQCESGVVGGLHHPHALRHGGRAALEGGERADDKQAAEGARRPIACREKPRPTAIINWVAAAPRNSQLGKEVDNGAMGRPPDGGRDRSVRFRQPSSPDNPDELTFVVGHLCASHVLSTPKTTSDLVDLGGHNTNRHVDVDGPAFALDS